jgi:uncharacterized protein
MTQSAGAPGAIVLSGFDLSEAAHPAPQGCEDCACFVGESMHLRSWPPAPEVTGVTHWVSGREITKVHISGDHCLLFNPVGSGGPVVVNERGLGLFRRFAQPVTLTEARAAGPECEPDAQYVFDRLSRLGFIHPADQMQHPDFAEGKLLTAWLHVTNACNLRCPYCYVHKSAEKMDDSIGRASVEAVIRSAVRHGFPAVKLKYAGGEASLNQKLLLDLHEHARTLAARNGITLYATLLSNGVRLSPALIGLLKSLDIRVMISLDGIDGQHDLQRPFANGKPSFPFVEHTIARLIEHGHPPHLSITITNRNFSGLAEVVRFALDRNLTFSLNFFRANECSTQFPDLQYEEHAMVASLLEAFGVIEELLPRWSVLGSILDRGQLLEPRQRSCGVGQDYVVIDQRGQVAKCHMEIERTLGDVIKDDPLQLVRKDLTLVQNLAVTEKEGCRDCTWRYWCSGGCSVATFRATGRYDIKSPNCGIYKAIYPEALRLEGLRILKYADAAASVLHHHHTPQRAGVSGRLWRVYRAPTALPTKTFALPARIA